MRCDDGRRPDEFVYRMRRRKRGHRVRAEIEQSEIRLVEIVHDRFHLAVDAGIPRQVGREPIGKFDDKSGWGPRLDAQAVGSESFSFFLANQAKRQAVSMSSLD